MINSLSMQDRIEIRGFGSFILHYRIPREVRNPKSGKLLHVDGKYVLYFKPCKYLRNRVNNCTSNT